MVGTSKSVAKQAEARKPRHKVRNPVAASAVHSTANLEATHPEGGNFRLLRTAA
jgi:hypothetical protein